MPSQPFSQPQQVAPKSILFERCRKAIDSGRRDLSLDALLEIRPMHLDATENRILEILMSRHRKRFEKNADDWIQPSGGVCGTKDLIDTGNGDSIHGGRRTRPDAAASKPKVSIITVNRNCAAGLEKTIRSVINQKDCGFDIEHIVIDGASTDDSIGIIRKYEDDLDYFISEPDGGIYSAMNKGLSLAQGDIIAFLNADDIYRRDAVGMSVRNIEQNGVDISYSAFAYLRPDGYVEVIDGPREWDEALLIRGIPGGHGTFFVTKETYNKVGGYREDMRIVADYDWMIKAYLAGCSARPIHRILLEMTQGGASFDETLGKDENCKLLSEYLGEGDEDRLDGLYSLKYYLNWHGQAGDSQDWIRLLDRAESLRGFESVYSKALVKTVNRSAQTRGGAIPSDPPPRNETGLRICVAVTYLNSVAGGAERIAIESANRLAEDGHAVTIICCHGLSGDPFYRIDERVRFVDLANKPLSGELYELGVKDWKKSWEEIKRTTNAGEAEDIDQWLDGANKWITLVYKGFFKANHFDAIVSHMPSTYPYIALALAGEATPPRHIASLHNSPKYKFHSELYLANSARERRVWLATLRMCDRISVLFNQFIDELPGDLRARSFVVPNFIGGTFLAGREMLRADRTERKIVTVGRLVPQKNQKALIDAFALIQSRIGDWKLEIYGEGPLRSELEDCCLGNGFDPGSILRGRTESPVTVYAAADIFVIPSHFEGFGLALVEAMASGVPVVGYDDCPGVKFIIENEVNGLLVKRDDTGASLADAILRLAADGEFRRRLGVNAARSAAGYTLDAHVARLGEQLRTAKTVKVCNARRGRPEESGLDIAMMNSYLAGGAGIAASRLQSGLQKIGISASMFSLSKGSIEPSFRLENNGGDPALNRANWQIGERSNLRNSGATIFASELGTVKNRAIRPALSHDVINLHWVSQFLSPSAVNMILNSGRPVVWTLHDMLPFTGGCHYTCGCRKFTTSCDRCPQVVNTYNDHPAMVLETKRELWQNRVTVVSPSVWLANEARKSKVFGGSRIEVVPNGIDTMEFRPTDKARARQVLGLPPDKKIILFACQSHGERRKGFQEALMLLPLLARKRDDLHLVTIGSPTDETDELIIANTGFGYIDSSETLSMIYSACDVTLLPSLEDNLPNIILESLCCGTPIAGFRTGGIEDLVKDGVTGYLAPTKDIVALRAAVERCIDSDFGESCRSYAVRNLDCTKQARAYAEIFRSVVKEGR